MLNPVAGQTSAYCVVYKFSLDVGSIMKQSCSVHTGRAAFLLSFGEIILFL